MAENKNTLVLQHHKQQSLCSTRLPYRQGRKMTAVKVYSVTKESNHLLIFGVPSLKLHQEVRAQFKKFGQLLNFKVSPQHLAEAFTETYHAQYERIQSARFAKRMLDTKNFYGGSLHVTYAPELESVEETRLKMIQRQKDILYRLINLQKVQNTEQTTVVCENKVAPTKLNMGEINTIEMQPPKKKKKIKNVAKQVNPKSNNDDIKANEINIPDIDVIDCTNTLNEVISNINEGLNYNKFGNEFVKKIPQKTLNKIKFHINKKV